MEIRKMPSVESRVETGPIQFGDDWPGVFIRGDNALYFAEVLNMELNKMPPTIHRGVLQGLVDDLRSCLV